MGDLGKLIVAIGFKKGPKVQQIAKSGHNGLNGSTVKCRKWFNVSTKEFLGRLDDSKLCKYTYYNFKRINWRLNFKTTKDVFLWVANQLRVRCYFRLIQTICYWGLVQSHQIQEVQIKCLYLWTVLSFCYDWDHNSSCNITRLCLTSLVRQWSQHRVGVVLFVGVHPDDFQLGDQRCITYIYAWKNIEQMINVTPT